MLVPHFYNALNGKDLQRYHTSFPHNDDHLSYRCVYKCVCSLSSPMPLPPQRLPPKLQLCMKMRREKRERKGASCLRENESDACPLLIRNVIVNINISLSLQLLSSLLVVVRLYLYILLLLWDDDTTTKQQGSGLLVLLPQREGRREIGTKCDGCCCISYIQLIFTQHRSTHVSIDHAPTCI